MKALITRGVRVQVTKQEYDLLQKLEDKMPFLGNSLNAEDEVVAKRLADKTILVRKKLTTTTQYNLNKNEKKLSKNKNFVSLTEKEIHLLELFLKQKGSVPKNEILNKVWKYSKDADTHTVETHIYRLRQKIKKCQYLLLLVHFYSIALMAY